MRNKLNLAQMVVKREDVVYPISDLTGDLDARNPNFGRRTEVQETVHCIQQKGLTNKFSSKDFCERTIECCLNAICD